MIVGSGRTKKGRVREKERDIEIEIKRKRNSNNYKGEEESEKGKRGMEDGSRKWKNKGMKEGEGGGRE